jgi:hypothetical protein
MALHDYAYIEDTPAWYQAQHPYALPEQIQVWIESELEKRRQHLQEKYPDIQLEIFLTHQTYQHLPVFILGYRQEERRFVREAWHYALRPAAGGEQGLQIVLDRVPLKALQTQVTGVEAEADD